MRITRLSISFIASLLLYLTLSSPGVASLEVPPLPIDIPIVDQTGTLTDEQKNSLAQQIASERDTSGNQLAVVMIPTLEGEPIENYSLSVAREWGIGTSENNNGILLLVVKEDKRLRIEVGRGLEGALTDAQSGRIIRNEITPNFQQNRYYEGIQAGLASIIAAINGEYTASTAATEQATAFPWEFLLFFGIMGLSWLGSILGRTKSWWAGGVIGGVAGGIVGFFTGSIIGLLLGACLLAILGLVFDKAVSANYRSHAHQGDKPSWWAGGGMIGGGGRSGGGGFGGFGGGGFGGGGASGGW